LTFPRNRALRAVAAIVRRDFAIRRSYRIAFALDLVFGLINLAIYFFISRTFGGKAAHHIGNAPSYFAFVLIGITLTLVIQAATTETVRTLRQEQLTGTLEALVMQPVRSRDVSLGFAVLPMVYAMIRAAAYLAIIILWLNIDVTGATWAGFAMMLVVTGAAMLAIGIAGCALVLVVKQGELVVGLVILVMGLFGGALFPVAVLPGWLSAIARLAPTRYAFDGARAAVYGGPGLATDVLALGLFAALALPISFVLFRKAMRTVRRVGSLAQY
jgi:ABC-2 type transport system permease protein